MKVLKLTKSNFENEVLNSDKTVLIDFFADWCGPCKMLSLVVEEIAEESSDTKVFKVNVDEEPELANAFGVSSIPMLAVLKDGKLISSSVGLKPKAAIENMINV